MPRERTPLDREMGTQQGRLRPASFTPYEGQYTYVLGADRPGVVGDFMDGDYVRVSQEGPWAAGLGMKARARLRCPVLPVGEDYWWEFKVHTSSGPVVASRALVPGRTREVTEVEVAWVFGAGNYRLNCDLIFHGTPGQVYRDVELPSVHLEQISFYSTVLRLQLLNRNPEPNEVQVPTDTLVALDLVDRLGVGVDLNNTLIEINGQRAYQNGVFYAPWDGPLSAMTVPYLHVRRLTCDYTGSYTSLSTLTVHVTSQTGDGLATLDETYTCTIEDVTQPSILPPVPADPTTSTQATSPTTLRVKFSEPVVQVDPAAANDALNPANYTITPVSVPSAEVVVLSVTTVDAQWVVLTLDTEMTEGSTYHLAAGPIEDLFGNPLVAPGNATDFVAPSLGAPTIRSFDLWKMLPEMNRREDDAGTGDLRRFIRCLQEVTNLLLWKVDKWVEILDPDYAPEAFLDAMLLDLGNPFAFDLTEIDKRRLLRLLLDIYRQKGTARGIINAIRFFLGIEVTILCYLDEETWVLGEDELGYDTYLGPGDSWGRYAFEINTGTVTLTDEQRQRITDIANYMKAAHTHLNRIVEPTTPPVYDHLELGVSVLDDEWELH